MSQCKQEVEGLNAEDDRALFRCLREEHPGGDHRYADYMRPLDAPPRPPRGRAKPAPDTVRLSALEKFVEQHGALLLHSGLALVECGRTRPLREAIDASLTPQLRPAVRPAPSRAASPVAEPTPPAPPPQETP